MRVLQGETPESLAGTGACSLPGARKLLAAVLQRGQLDVRDPLPLHVKKREADVLSRDFRVGRLREVAREASAVDPFVKYLFGLDDGAVIETVQIPLHRPGRINVCVSSQVGCALGCTYCATGRLGLSRNLEAWEIVEQVRHVRSRLPSGSRVHGVVFQGMGEPLANIDRVIQALAVLSNPAGLAIDQRAITVSTVGLPRGIERLLSSGFRVRLGVSIGSARPERRPSLMPIQNQFPLEQVLEAVAAFVRRWGDAPMFAMTLIAGENTSEDDARAFGDLAARFRAETGVTPRLSLVDYNPSGPTDPRLPPSQAELTRFREVLGSYSIPVVRRYSGGKDVGGACGQLVGQRSQGAGAPQSDAG